ncbi:MAG: ABC transporter ATP-binding protein/permease [Gammaproteobacteria bacterium]|nr:ABC transporter ATP-binding protein/permease [Gammaproteobacteria bacterium]
MIRDLSSRPYTAWQLIKAYWQSEQRVSAYALYIAVIIMSITIIGMDVIFNYWYNGFYDALQDYNKASAYDLIKVFIFLAAVFIILAVYRYYMQQYLGLRWRRWLTNQFLNRWLENKGYYYLENFDETTDNPDQRIQEDINALVNSSLDLSIGLFTSITTFFAFIYILWTLSGNFVLHLGPLGTHTIHGYLVWVAIIYAIIGTRFAFKIGYPLVSLNFEQQRREANFRFAAVDLRSHAEHVALYRGEASQKNILSSLFDRVLENYYAIILRQKLLLWFTAGYNQVSVILPLVVVLPNYFGKVFKLGGLMQALRAFGQIQEALSFLVSSYSQIAQYRAVIRRLLGFLNHIYTVENNVLIHNKFLRKTQFNDVISLRHLTIRTPQGENLLENINEEFVHGKNYLIKGASGIGKSTFIRVISGIWPYGEGEITLPLNKKIMYIPQKSYMPIGTLKEALLYPEDGSMCSDNHMRELLLQCDLPNLAERLQDISMWSEQLSSGELQRIALVRILIHEPDWVFLDESTSALDLPHEKELYTLIKSALPNCSLVSVGHQPSVEAFHDELIDLSKYKVHKEVYG